MFTLFAGCASSQRYKVVYLDMNKDGIIDREDHSVPASDDNGWMLKDTNHDGFYDVKEYLGFGGKVSIHEPVPRGKPISTDRHTQCKGT